MSARLSFLFFFLTHMTLKPVALFLVIHTTLELRLSHFSNKSLPHLITAFRNCNGILQPFLQFCPRNQYMLIPLIFSLLHIWLFVVLSQGSFPRKRTLKTPSSRHRGGVAWGAGGVSPPHRGCAPPRKSFRFCVLNSPFWCKMSAFCKVHLLGIEGQIAKHKRFLCP